MLTSLWIALPSTLVRCAHTSFLRGCTCVVGLVDAGEPPGGVVRSGSGRAGLLATCGMLDVADAGSMSGLLPMAGEPAPLALGEYVPGELAARAASSERAM